MERCFGLLPKDMGTGCTVQCGKHWEMFAVTLPGAVGSELGWRGQQGQWWLFSPYLVRGLLLGMEMGVRGVLSCCPAPELPRFLVS